MGTLVYAPGVEVLIDSRKMGTIDVTNDLVMGQMQLVENRPHTFNFAIQNRDRRYDGVFQCNDRIVVRMKRLRWLQTYAGYLNRVPIFSIYPRTVRLQSTCTLKRVQYHYWDPSTLEAEQLLHQDDDITSVDTDGGMKKKLMRVLTEVAGWPREHIHIAEVPKDWFSAISDLYDKLGDRIGTNQAIIGSGATIFGQDSNPGPTRVEGTNRFTGNIPASSGRSSTFGGPAGGAYGPFELTGEPGGMEDSARQQYGGPYYCAMRWPYLIDDGTKPVDLQRAGTPAEVNAARQWWKNRKILVTNPDNGNQVVVRAADWGPARWTGYTIDLSRAARESLAFTGGDTDVTIGFASESAALGPVTHFNPISADAAERAAHGGGASAPVADTGTLQLPEQKPEGTTNIDGDDFAWGGYQNGKIPGDKMAQVTAPNNQKYLMHPLAAAAYERMRDAALKDGVSLNMSGAYRTYETQVSLYAEKPNLAARPGTSNHGWGFAIDFWNIGGYSGAYFIWLKQHAHEYGWVHPPWAAEGGRREEPWHWEFWAGLGLTPLPADLEPLAAGAFTPGEDPLFNTAQWGASIPADVLEAEILSGPRALMNDEPLLKTVQVLFGASMRSFCSAPNGDLIGWFPDYFGIYGTAGKIIIEDIELLDFTVDWVDDFLKTHLFTSGASTGFGAGGQIGGEDATSIWQKYTTTGIASIEFPEIIKALFGVTADNDPLGWLDSEAFLQKHGARPDYQSLSTISDPRAVFWYAVYLFQKNWAEQFQANIPLTFMPEAWPGMLVQIPTIRGEQIGFQAYIEAVTHTFDFNEGGGFSTSLAITAPSVIRNGRARPLVLVMAE